MKWEKNKIKIYVYKIKNNTEEDNVLKYTDDYLYSRGNPIVCMK